ncbi:beta-lactamase-like protein [Lophiotrema nucula]|uniref:Cleavage and polyadenylation specificity factor subunit 2 n=1 Tax=Lophiotrema nucula TaxID=690887 RepID=A0A6A5YH98_9PLEO|nr:beta-lactamase-like protein [Lophiotrema nucula]
MFNFTPLLGAQSASAASQSLLEFDGGIKILIDVGWDEGFDAQKLKELEKHVPTLSFVLLTHATTAHLGAYAHCCKHFPGFSRIPVYATVPVVSLGRTLLLDIYASTPLANAIIPPEALGEFNNARTPNILLQPPSPEDITKYFSTINSLKYSQQHQPIPAPHTPPLSGLTVTAYSAGHTLGGTIWHIQYGMESVVYAVDWNQAREHVLSGAAWLGGGSSGSEVLEQLRRPTALVCSSKGTGLAASARQRNTRDDALLSLIRETVQKGGSVLIPSDSSARVLELSYLLEETWQAETTKSGANASLKEAKIYLASRAASKTMNSLKSMLEWMEEGILKDFEAASAQEENQQQQQQQNRGRGQHVNKGDDEKQARHPFEFRHITILERKSRVNRMLATPEPKIIVASDTSLEWGFSKDAIEALASDERNLIILTERVGEPVQQQKGLGRHLWELWHERSQASAQELASAAIINLSNNQVDIQSTRIAPLEGKSENELYQQYQARRKQLASTTQGEGGTATAEADAREEGSETSSESSDDDDIDNQQQGNIIQASAIAQHKKNKTELTDAELGINILIRKKTVFDYEVAGKKGREKMFPYVAKRRRADEFGDMLRQDEYKRADETDQVAGEALRDANSKQLNAIGQKRKWDDQAIRNVNGVAPKRTRPDGTADDEPSEDEEDKIQGPSKVIFGTATININCRISFVDFSGLHDLRTITMILPLVKPRKVILVAGEADETTELKAKLDDLLKDESKEGESIISTPTIGQTIDASVDTNAWTVKLSRSMVRKLQWQNVRGLGVVAITGRLEAASLNEPSEQLDESAANKKAKLDASTSASAAKDPDKMDTTPILDVVPTNIAARSTAQPFHVGDLRLADLRKLMQASGMTAEFRGEGTLVINGTVAVRKTGTGKIEVDGGAYALADPRSADSGTFFKVKKKIYEGLAVVAGG